MKTQRKKVLLLGASGRVGQGLIEEFKTRKNPEYELILGIHNSIPEGAENLPTRKFSLYDSGLLKKAMEGIDVVVNFAGNSDEGASREDLIKPNLIGTRNVFNAAKAAGCKRVILASSVYAIKGYPEEYVVQESDEAKPINDYGEVKKMGEEMCQEFASKGLSCLSIRIGAFVRQREIKNMCLNRKDFRYVITQRDMGNLFDRAIMAEDNLNHAVLHGTSANARLRMGLDLTRKSVGYNPQDDAFRICNIA